MSNQAAAQPARPAFLSYYYYPPCQYFTFRARDDGQARCFYRPSVYFLFNKKSSDSGLPADLLVGKLKKDIS